MKHALDSSERLLEASADAPQQAVCPRCGALVILRCRQRSSRAGDLTYFWRHQDHAHPNCPARFSVTVKGQTERSSAAPG